MTTHAVRTVTADRPLTQRSRRTNDPLADANQTTATGRRIADLTRAFLAELGDPDDVTLQARAVAAAEMITLSEEARAAALKSGGVDLDRLDRVIRLEGAVARSVRALGLPDRRRGPAEPTLSDAWNDEDEPEGEDALIVGSGTQVAGEPKERTGGPSVDRAAAYHTECPEDGPA
jgi:hypothetical protein